MQHVGDQSNLVKNGNDQPAGGLSPAKAFFALLALLVAIGGLFLLTRLGDDPDPGPAPKSDNFALTDAEAIERFKELDALRIKALEARDPSLLSQAFTGTSPVAHRVSTSIRKLKRSNVTLRNNYRQERLSVLSNEGSEVVIKQTVTFDVRFFSSSGEEVTRGGGLERQVLEWTLRRVGDKWLIQNGLIVKAEPIDENE